MSSRKKFCRYSQRQKIRIIEEQTVFDLNNLNKSISSSGSSENDHVFVRDVRQDDSSDGFLVSDTGSISGSLCDDGPSSSQSSHSSTSFLTDLGLGIEPDIGNTGNGLRKDLGDWAIKYNINHNALSSLLSILRANTTLDLPLDARTLLKTPRTIDVQPMGGGHYWHYGLHNVLSLIHKNLQCKENIPVESINLLINIDGLPLSKSSNSCFWPILVSEAKLNIVFIAGCFYGNEKPADSNEFLSYLVSEIKYYLTNGYKPNEESESISVFLEALICDAPAKAFLLKIKGHAGYSSCTKCTIVGEFVNNRVCFPYPTEPCGPILRTDSSVKSMTDEDYHTGTSILNTVPNFGLVSQLPLDYMHLVCLGVMKKLLNLWICGPLNVRLSGREIQEISEKLISIRKSVPNEFQRKPRELKYYKLWKATEFRQLLLYSGPVVLKDHMKKDVMKNFLALHVAVTILTKSEFAVDSDFLAYADALLKYFVKTFEVIYGRHHISHNVHGLLHLTRDVERFGPLDVFGAFKFESYLSKIKKRIKKSDLPLQQLAKRYVEEEINNMLPPKSGGNKGECLKDKQKTGLLSANISNNEVLDHFISFCSETIYIHCTDEKNNTFLFKDGSVAIVKNIVQVKSNDEAILICSGCKFVKNLYTLDSFESSTLKIEVIDEDLRSLKSYKISDIKCKLWRMVYGNNFVIFPLHNNYIL